MRQGTWRRSPPNPPALKLVPQECPLPPSAHAPCDQSHLAGYHSHLGRGLLFQKLAVQHGKSRPPGERQVCPDLPSGGDPIKSLHKRTHYVHSEGRTKMLMLE